MILQPVKTDPNVREPLLDVSNALTVVIGLSFGARRLLSSAQSRVFAMFFGDEPDVCGVEQGIVLQTTSIEESLHLPMHKQGDPNGPSLIHNTVKLLINVVDSAAASALVNVLTSGKVSLIDREQLVLMFCRQWNLFPLISLSFPMYKMCTFH